MKDELGAKIVIGFISWIKKTCSYLIDDYGEDKKNQKAPKKCAIKKQTWIKNCQNCLETAQLKNIINHLKK